MSTEKLLPFLDRNLENALERHGLEITAPAQKYLVEMLGRFTDTFGVYQEKWLTPITFQYQHITEELGRLQRTQQQQELGDHCLFLIGFFYDYVRQHGKGQIRYHAELGSGAYLQTGKFPLVEMGEKFNDLYLVIGDLHLPTIDDERIVSLYQKWLDTGDRYYESLLVGKGIVPKEIKLVNN